MDRRAYSEANYIINSMPEKMKNKIPDDIITNIQNKMDKEYIVSFKDIEYDELLPDTEKLLAVLYADYIATEEERKLIKDTEKRIKDKKIQEINKNVINPFKKVNTSTTKQSITIIKKKKWYEKIFSWIKKCFK
jgi:hypothetical protein